MGTFLFYGWGLGLWGKVGPAADLALAILLYAAIQVPLSVWWFRHFQFGPMEYLWRTLTYGRPPVLRLPETARAASAA
jgi:uncharacterized protein